MNGNFISRFMWGLFIIVVGVGLMLRQSGVIDFDIGLVCMTYWPLILLFVGVQGMLQRAAYGIGSFFGSSVLLILGFIFLGRNLDWFIWSVGDIMQFAGPLVLILFGLRMILKPKAKKKDAVPGDEEWKAYTSYSPFDQDVPPAPPLHPDPTKEPEAKEQQGAAKEQPMGAQIPPHPTEGQIPQRPVQPFEPFANHHAKQKWEERAARTRAHIERHAAHRKRIHDKFHHRNDRVEWWNHDPSVQTRSGFIGDIYLGQDYWELKPMNISHFIGDTVLDLTKAQILPGETKIYISSFIGDVKVYLPDDYEVGVHVVSSAFVGDVAVLEHREGGIFKNMDIETPLFNENEKKIKLHVSTFIGDVRVTKVG
ncbi:cell wall-active antibiotics response protein LiaF [Paenibacillus silvisoli]|uniref:cell wall-active antibiotics response protein LiaF n=1 Tax=Paenibacillus silvisoli TaxID=3110539 RepID=UPI0028061300|nr:cell wall-active antibiotics response protein LiaF [Paenibacillus silvisoli]